ncbi:hypothetical protein DFH08DRAFT_943142 [Mycena albidolilacea]|uniref:Protein kinase domain-containing protein n=1 Tax=Mycena albidolilacea TaxID=1033008 RepID=A0AAD6ZC10_9AGAR|nr:hypothetical protein DFH08DRAFT_943142 [Mycena albidolilacea]
MINKHILGTYPLKRLRKLNDTSKSMVWTLPLVWTASRTSESRSAAFLVDLTIDEADRIDRGRLDDWATHFRYVPDGPAATLKTPGLHTRRHTPVPFVLPSPPISRRTSERPEFRFYLNEGCLNNKDVPMYPRRRHVQIIESSLGVYTVSRSRVSFPFARSGNENIYRGRLQLSDIGSIRVAIKMIRLPDDEDSAHVKRRLRREVAICQGLRHRNILPFFGMS